LLDDRADGYLNYEKLKEVMESMMNVRTSPQSNAVPCWKREEMAARQPRLAAMVALDASLTSIASSIAVRVLLSSLRTP